MMSLLNHLKDSIDIGSSEEEHHEFFSKISHLKPVICYTVPPFSDAFISSLCMHAEG